jgi:archaemetzincin
VKSRYIAPVGNVPAGVLNWIEAAVADWFHFPVRRLPPLPIPAEAYDAGREQYQSVPILHALAQAAPQDAARILGVTEVDLTIPMLSFLFGQAQLEGTVALISLCRLRQEFYGFDSDEELLRQRTVKEALHELGHTYGLTHCAAPECVMSLATHVALVDEKSERYCARCGTQLTRRLAREIPEPATRGELV